MRGMLDDNKGQAIPIEYILIFTISLIFFGTFMLVFNTVIDGSSSQAMYLELTDIGNEISSAITKTYLTAPSNGVNNLTLDIPAQIAGDGYFIELEKSPFENEGIALKLTSMHRSVTTFVPLNSVGELIKINGTVSSASGKIYITGNATDIMLY